MDWKKKKTQFKAKDTQGLEKRWWNIFPVERGKQGGSW